MHTALQYAAMLRLRSCRLLGPAALLTLACAAATADRQPANAPDTAPPAIWFDDARDAPPLSDFNLQTLAEYLRRRLLHGLGDPSNTPDSLKADKAPRLVFVSVSDGATAARVALGAAKGAFAATNDALTRLRPRDGDKFTPRWIKLDVVTNIFPRQHVDLAEPLEFERSLLGMAFDRATGVALLSEQMIGRELVDARQIVFPDRIAAYIKQSAVDIHRKLALTDVHDATLFRFTTTSVFIDRDQIVPLYRGHRMYRKLARRQLLDAAHNAGRYLARAAGPYGQFEYTYYPDRDRVPDEYDVVGHVGAVAAMFDAYEATGDRAILEAGKRALEYAQRFTGKWKQRGRPVYALVQNRKVSLGGNALMTFALARLAQAAGTVDKKTQVKLEMFGRALAAAQKDDGDFVQLQGFPSGNVYEYMSGSYPGEAILALLQLNKVDPRLAWVDTADKAARYLITVRDKNVPPTKLPHDHWLLYGLNELYRQRPDARYYEHSMRIARAIYRVQNRSPRYADWLGSYLKPPGSTPTATRTTGLVAAYRLARDHGDENEARRILEAAILGAAFQLQTQFRPETAMYFKDPQRILGAFRESLTSPDIRIDFVQHNMLGLLNLWRVMKQEQRVAFDVPKPRKRDAAGVNDDAGTTPSGKDP